MQRLLGRLQLRLDKLGRMDWETWWVDGSNIRVARRAAGTKKGDTAALGRSHGGWGSKLHLLTDGNALPLPVLLIPGQCQESYHWKSWSWLDIATAGEHGCWGVVVTAPFESASGCTPAPHSL